MSEVRGGLAEADVWPRPSLQTEWGGFPHMEKNECALRARVAATGERRVCACPGAVSGAGPFAVPATGQGAFAVPDTGRHPLQLASVGPTVQTVGG